jgi:AraC-like DNA-binding protein
VAAGPPGQGRGPGNLPGSPPSGEDGALPADGPILDFATTDLDTMRETVARVFHLNRVRVVGRSRTVDAHARYAELGALGILRLRYGAHVEVEHDPIGRHAVVAVPLSGATTMASGGRSVVSTPSLASVTSPHLPMRHAHSADCEEIVLRFDHDRLARHCGEMLGRELSQPLELDLGLPLDDGPGRSFLRLVRYLQAETDRANPLLRTPLAAAELEGMAMTALLTAHSHSYAEALRRPQAAVAPFYVKRAEAYIEANADRALTMAELAAEAGVSARSLQSGFQDFRGTTPMAFLRDLRLQRAHDDLLAADPARDNVTTIAMRWGVTHLGRFAEAYRRKFGESPSDTLRRAR